MSADEKIAPDSTRSRFSRAARGLLQGILGLSLGLGVAESVFRFRDGGAFPLPNVYEADPARGLRLRPGGQTLVGQRGERITHVRINEDGYRGAAWPEPTQDEILFVGDSMSFGLGIEENETVAARLREMLGGRRSVIDASVPTYGPPEYLTTMEQVLGARRPKVVVMVVNLLNDFGEIGRPNTERHAVLDGWAIRRSKSAPPPPSSKLREIAIRHSHAAFALWRWQRTREAIAAPPEPDHGLRDLLALATARQSARAAARDTREPVGLSGLGLAGLGEGIGLGYREVPMTPEFKMVRKHWKVIAASGQGFWDPAWNAHLDDHHLEGRPTWIAWCGYGAASWEDVRIHAAAQDAHRKMLGALRKYLAWRGADPAIQRELEETAKADAPKPAPPAPELPPLPIQKIVIRALQIAKSKGAELLVLPVPLDVQISAEARARHGISEVQAKALDALVDGVIGDAWRADAHGADPTYALLRAGALAYLPDGHLSAVGHDTLAKVITDNMRL